MRIGRLKLISFFICAFFIAQGGMAMAANKSIKLPEPDTKGKMSLEEAIFKRRSKRIFLQRDLSIEQLGQLLWAAQGITRKTAAGGFRTAPSAGALYPMEVYVLTKDGLYHYVPDGHKLEMLADKDLRSLLTAASHGQAFVAQAAVDIVITAVFKRITEKYGERGINYCYTEAGHIAQNIHLQAVALGLGSVPVGAFTDTIVKRVLSLPQGEEPVYIISVGYAE